MSNYVIPLMSSKILATSTVENFEMTKVIHESENVPFINLTWYQINILFKGLNIFRKGWRIFFFSEEKNIWKIKIIYGLSSKCIYRFCFLPFYLFLLYLGTSCKVRCLVFETGDLVRFLSRRNFSTLFLNVCKVGVDSIYLVRLKWVDTWISKRPVVAIWAKLEKHQVGMWDDKALFEKYSTLRKGYLVTREIYREIIFRFIR